MIWPPLHPMIHDRVESERCPDCGHPGRLIRSAGPLQEWGCPLSPIGSGVGMTDARFPERWLNDRRIVRLSDAAFRLHVVALTWSVSNRTDGVLYDDDLTMLPAVDTARAAELVKAGLWCRDGGRWLIVDFADTQTTREQLDAAAQAREHDRLSKSRRRLHQRGDHSRCTPELCDSLAVRADVRADNTGQDRPGQDRQNAPREGQENARARVAPGVLEISAAGRCPDCGLPSDSARHRDKCLPWP